VICVDQTTLKKPPRDPECDLPRLDLRDRGKRFFSSEDCDIPGSESARGVKGQEMPKATVVQKIKGTVKVNVDADKRRGFLAPRALGVVFPIGDAKTMDPLMGQILQSAGVTTLRYPAAISPIPITGPLTSRRSGRELMSCLTMAATTISGTLYVYSMHLAPP
jgi:hypothetical protein